MKSHTNELFNKKQAQVIQIYKRNVMLNLTQNPYECTSYS